MTWIDSEFEDNLLSLLHDRKFDDILQVLKDPKHDTFVLENVWNLINLVCQTVKLESLLKNDDDVCACKKILMMLVNKGNPKEVLLALLEQADSFKDHKFFCLLLEPLQSILLKNPGKRGKSLQWVLSTLNAHIQTLDLPKDLDLQGEEKLLLDVDPAVQDTAYVLSCYLSFIESLVDEVSFLNLKNKEIYYIQRINQQQEILQRYILKLLFHPLLYHDLHIISDNRPKSTIQSLCENYIKCLSKICKNVYSLFKYRPSNKNINLDECHDIDSNEEEVNDEDEDNVPELALSNLSYLIFVEHMTLDFQPLVYSHLFIFMKNLNYILPLLRSTNNLVLYKGLALADVLLNDLNDSELNYDCIELNAFTEFPKLLLTVAITSQFEAHRKTAVKIFTLYVSKCNSKGRYHLIMQVLSTINHSGAEGLVINLYKNYLHKAVNGDKSCSYFLGKNLNLFLKKVFILKEGVETDLLENSDRIVTSLNLLRYLLLRDSKEKNITGIWDLTNHVSESFISPLTTGLDLSRAHYKQSLKDATVKGKEKGLVNTVVTVNKEVLPNVPVCLEKDLYNKALTTFDMIESLLCRVKELMP